MQAQVITEFGPPSVFKKMDLPKPRAKAGHVVIHVKATSINPLDCKIRSGDLAEISPAFPAILHGDVAGIIEEVGPEVERFKKGDAVYGCAGGVMGTQGALAEYMLADADCLAKKPHALSFVQAAALPLVTITAWTALLNAGVEAGHSLLVHGGVGGVGHIAVQLGKWAGAKVAATVGSEEDFERAYQLGAQDVINFRKEAVSDYVQRITQGKGFQRIFDTVGGKNLDLSFQAAALNGVISTTIARSTNDLSPMHQKGLSLHVVFMLIPLLHNIDRRRQGKILEKAAAIADAGKLVPLIDKEIFSFSEVSKAHAYLESGKAKGKIIITI